MDNNKSVDLCEGLIQCIEECIKNYRRINRRHPPIQLRPTEEPEGRRVTDRGLPMQVDSRGRPLSKDIRQAKPGGQPSKKSLCEWLLGLEPGTISKTRPSPLDRGGLSDERKFNERVPGEPGVIKTTEGRRVNSRVKTITEGYKPEPKEPRVSAETSPTPRWCDWIRNKPPSREKRLTDDDGRSPIPDGLKPVRGEPGVFTTPGGTKVDKEGHPVPAGWEPAKDEPVVFRPTAGKGGKSRGVPIPERYKPTSDPRLLETPPGRKDDSSKSAEIPTTRSFCDWLRKKPPSREKGPTDDNRRRSIPDGLKPVRGEPGVFTTPGGTKVDKEGHPVPAGWEPGKRGGKSRGVPIPERYKPTSDPELFKTPPRRKDDSPKPAKISTTLSFCDWLWKKPPSREKGPADDNRRRPIPDGLKPVRGEPGVFTSPGGTKVDKEGHPVPAGWEPGKKGGKSRGVPIPERYKPTSNPELLKTPPGRKDDSPKPAEIPTTRSFCDWLWKKPPSREKGPADDNRRGPIPDGLKPVRGEPGVFTTPGGTKVDKEGHPVPAGLKPVKDRTPSGKRVTARGAPIPENLQPIHDEPGLFTTPSGRKPASRKPSRTRPADEEPQTSRTSQKPGGLCDSLFPGSRKRSRDTDDQPEGQGPSKQQRKGDEPSAPRGRKRPSTIGDGDMGDEATCDEIMNCVWECLEKKSKEKRRKK